MVEVWITGAGAVSALGSGVEVHRDAMLQKRSGLVPFNFFGGNAPDPCVCGLISDDVAGGSIEESASNRAKCILSFAMKQLVHNSKIVSDKEADVVIGTTLGNMHGGTVYYRNVHAGKKGDSALLKHFLPCSPIKHVIDEYKLRGSHLTVSSACGSAAAAIGHAVKRIRSGRAKRAIAGGFDALSPYVVAGFNSLRLVSQHPCKPFDANRDGLNPGEAAVLFCIESRESALKRGATPLAKIDGFGDNLEAFHYTRANPEGVGVAAALKKALSEASINKKQVSHIHLHGTGTEANDFSEYMACRTIFGDKLSDIPVCSTKSMTGHTFGGAAALSVLFSILTLETGIVPATLYCDHPDPQFERLNISSDSRKISTVDRVVSTALGFGGESFAIIVSKVTDR